MRILDEADSQVKDCKAPKAKQNVFRGVIVEMT